MKIYLLLAALAGPLAASQVTFNFSGRVTSVWANSFLGVSTGVAVGDLVDGTGSFDPTLPDRSSSSGIYFAYDNTGGFLNVRIYTSAGILIFNGTDAYQWNYDQAIYPLGDYYQLSSYGPSAISVPSVPSVNSEMTLYFIDGLAPYDMLDGITPPAAGLPDLSKANLLRGGFVRDNGSNLFHIEFELLDAPEPATMAPFLAGIAAIALRRRKSSAPN